MGWFTVAELRAQDAALEDPGNYTDGVLQAAIDDACAAMEDAMHVAFQPRSWTGTLSGTGRIRLFVPLNEVRSVTSATVAGVALDVSAVGVVESSCLVRVDGAWLDGPANVWPEGVSNIVVTVEHGYDAPPRHVRRAGLVLARVWALRGPIDARATQVPAGDGAVLNLAQPGVRGSTFGVPEVDGVVLLYGERDPVLTVGVA